MLIRRPNTMSDVGKRSIADGGRTAWGHCRDCICARGLQTQALMAPLAVHIELKNHRPTAVRVGLFNIFRNKSFLCYAALQVSGGEAVPEAVVVNEGVQLGGMRWGRVQDPSRTFFRAILRACKGLKRRRAPASIDHTT